MGLDNRATPFAIANAASVTAVLCRLSEVQVLSNKQRKKQDSIARVLLMTMFRGRPSFGNLARANTSVEIAAHAHLGNAPPRVLLRVLPAAIRRQALGISGCVLAAHETRPGTVMMSCPLS